MWRLSRSCSFGWGASIGRAPPFRSTMRTTHWSSLNDHFHLPGPRGPLQQSYEVLHPCLPSADAMMLFSSPRRMAVPEISRPRTPPPPTKPRRNNAPKAAHYAPFDRETDHKAHSKRCKLSTGFEYMQARLLDVFRARDNSGIDNLVDSAQLIGACKESNRPVLDIPP